MTTPQRAAYFGHEAAIYARMGDAESAVGYARLAAHWANLFLDTLEAL